MPERTTFRLCGVALRVDAPDASFWPLLSARLPPVEALSPAAPADRRYAVRDDDGARPGMAVRRGARLVLNAPTAAVAADLVVDDVERFLACRAEGLVFVHAGAVAWNGQAILLPGRSGSGKSELVAALLRAGAEYLSDEFAVIDEQGRAHPYARPIVLRRDGFLRVGHESLGARVPARPLPVGRIAVLRHRPGAAWNPTKLSAGEALLELLSFALAGRQRLDLASRTLRLAAIRAEALKGARGEADGAARALIAGMPRRPGGRGGDAGR